MPRAIVVTGVGSNHPGEIIADLETKGYDVEVYRYYDRDLPSSDGLTSDDLVIGHSAGGTRVQHTYRGSDAEVISMGAPTRLGGSGVRHVTNFFDPIGWISSNIPSFARPGFGAHNFTTYYQDEYGDFSNEAVGEDVSSRQDRRFSDAQANLRKKQARERRNKREANRRGSVKGRYPDYSKWKEEQERMNQQHVRSEYDKYDAMFPNRDKGPQQTQGYDQWRAKFMSKDMSYRGRKNRYKANQKQQYADQMSR